MKKLIGFVMICLLMGVVHAESYLIVENSTNEILSCSPEDDAQLPDDNYTKIIIKDNYWDIDLDEQANMYKFKNGKFIKNIKKISDKEIEKEKAEEKNKEEKLITERMRKIARDQLIEEGAIKEWKAF